MIESQGLKVGEKLPAESALGQSFDVGRPVIREALGRLRALGLVVSYSGKGSFVASQRISPNLAVGGYSSTELNEVRLHLELPVAGIAAQRRTEDDLVQLDAALLKFETTSDPRERSAVDADFHLGIAKATGNGLFVRLIRDLRQQLQDQAQAVSAPDRAIQAAHEHRAILDAIRNGDSAAAIKAMRDHLESVELSMKKQTNAPFALQGKKSVR